MMKKVEIETVCGEKSVIYVSQDVESITIDGKPFKQEDMEDEERLPPSDDSVQLSDLLEKLTESTNEEYDYWTVNYEVVQDPEDEDNYFLKIDFAGDSLPKAVFKL